MSENPLIGYWRLISCNALRNHGTRVPAYGKNPSGRLYYDARGNMSVHIMRAGRRRNGSAGRLGAEDEGAKSAYDGYQAYFSTYAVDTERKVVRHKVLGSLYPDWTGTTQVRYYEFQDCDHLLLSTAPIGSQPQNDTIFELVWERIN